MPVPHEIHHADLVALSDLLCQPQGKVVVDNIGQNEYQINRPQKSRLFAREPLESRKLPEPNYRNQHNCEYRCHCVVSEVYSAGPSLGLLGVECQFVVWFGHECDVLLILL